MRNQMEHKYRHYALPCVDIKILLLARL